MLIFQLVRKVAAQVISTTRYPYDALVKLLFDGESLNPNRCAASIAGTLSDTCVFGTKSLQITANTDGITVPHTSFELQQYMRYGDWSLEAMVDFDSLSDGDDGETAAGNGVIPVFAKWYTFGATNADNSFILYVNTSGYLQLYFNDSRLATATATSTISLTGFRKVVLSRFRNNLCVHVDGVLVIRADVYGALNWSTADTQPYHKFYIGSWYDAGTGFHRELEGRIEGVRFTVGASIYSSADYDYKEYDVVDSMNEPQPDCLVLPADSSIQEAYGRTVTKFGGIALAADGSMEFDGVGKYITVAMGGTDKACKFAECEVQITGNFTNLTNGGVVLSTSGWALRLVYHPAVIDTTSILLTMVLRQGGCW